MEVQTAIAASALAPAAVSGSTLAQPLFHRIWPTAVIALGLGLTAVWTCLLGYGLVSLIIMPAFRLLVALAGF